MDAADAVAKNPEQRREVEERHQRGGQRQAGVTESPRADHGGGGDEVDQDGAEADQHRRARVVERVEGGRQNLDGGVPAQADRIAGQRQGGLLRVVGAERAVLVDGADHGLTDYDQADRRRQRQQEDHAERSGQGPAKLIYLAERRALGNCRKSGRRDGHAK